MFKSYKKEVFSALNIAEQKALELIGEEGVSAEVKEITDKGLVDTGFLRNGSMYETQKDHVKIGNSVKYAPYLELGTSRQSAKPFLKPAIMGSYNKFKKLTELAFKEVFK